MQSSKLKHAKCPRTSLVQWPKQNRTWEHIVDLVQVCQWEGEAGTGEGTNFTQGRANQQSSGHRAARHLDEVGASNQAVCHLEGHLAVEPPED